MHKYTLMTKAHAKACRAMTKGALAILRTYICNEDTLHSFDLLLTEATANCARHAYKHVETGDAEIVLEVTHGESVTTHISDWGMGFSDSSIDIYVPQILNPEAESGRGLYIISSLATVFHVTEDNGKNTIHATLQVPRESWMR